MNVMEKFMLAAVDTRNSILYNYGMYSSYGLSGIAIVELIRLGRLDIESDLITVKDASSTGNELLDEVLQAIAAKEKPKKMDHWVASLPYKVKRFDKRVMEKLEDNGALRIEQGRILLLFPSRKYIVTDESERNKTVNACREAILSGNRSPEYETMLILSITAACSFAEKFFSKDELKGLKETFKQLRKGNFFIAGDNDLAKKVAFAVQKAISAAQTAVITTTTS
jgi:hypothetical protein